MPEHLIGFLDAHPASIAAPTLAAEGRMTLEATALACLLGISTNTASKVAVAVVFGGAAYGLRVALGLLTALAAAAAGFVAPF